MGGFGNPPEKGAPQQYFPGISGRSFDMVSAQKCWLAAIHKEKRSRSVHQFLDAHGKLGLDEKWAKDMSEKRDLLPGSAFVAGVYKKLGWVVLPSGQVVQPDVRQRLGRPRRASAPGLAAEAALDEAAAEAAAAAAARWHAELTAGFHPDATSTSAPRRRFAPAASGAASLPATPGPPGAPPGPQGERCVVVAGRRSRPWTGAARKAKAVGMVRAAVVRELAAHLDATAGATATAAASPRRRGASVPGVRR